MNYVYFDHNATTPLHERVCASMLPFMREHYGNASSRHGLGTAARKAVEEAREKVAALVNAEPSQVIFTGGGTEANNLFIKGAAAYLPARRIAISSIEHPCVAKAAQELTRGGWSVRKLAVDQDGRTDLTDAKAALRESIGVASVMLANNETGVVQEIAEIAVLARESAVLMHTDAVQALGKIPVDFEALQVHAMTLSAHKIEGPKGVGALIFDTRISLRPLLVGGGHERGLRSGTYNVPAIVGFGVACELAANGLDALASRTAELREALERGLRDRGAVIFGGAAPRLPNTTYFAFSGIDGETLVIELDKAGYAVASGAACSSMSAEPSATLRAMGVAPELAHGAVRISLGRTNTQAEVDTFLHALDSVRSKLQRLAAIVV